jgi:hypothetical protein
MTQAAPPRTPPLGVAFDSSLDGDVDQVLALAMLFGFDVRRQIRLASLSLSRYSLLAVAYLDLVARFYRGEQATDIVADRLSLPVGMSTLQVANGAPPMLSVVLAKNVGNVGEARIYPRGRAALNDTADPVALIRNALSAQVDQNGAVILAGSPVNLLGVIARPDGRDWVTRKARALNVAAGRFADGPVDATVQRDVTGFRRLLAEWPSPIVMAGTELNEALPFPGQRFESGTTWTMHHPVLDSYRAFGTQHRLYVRGSYDAPSRTLAAVLHAVEPDQSYFDVSPPGTITIGDDGRTTFSPSPGGRHRYLIARVDHKERVLQRYVDTVTAQPPPRPGRGGARPAASTDLGAAGTMDV